MWRVHQGRHLGAGEVGWPTHLGLTRIHWRSYILRNLSVPGKPGRLVTLGEAIEAIHITCVGLWRTSFGFEWNAEAAEGYHPSDVAWWRPTLSSVSRLEKGARLAAGKGLGELPQWPRLKRTLAPAKAREGAVEVRSGGIPDVEWKNEKSRGTPKVLSWVTERRKWPFPETEENRCLTGRSGVKCEIPVRYASGNVA